MKIGIMQPYFFPYIGYFQLISSVDKFLLYDNINFIKNGWISRNRILEINREPVYFYVPLKGKSSFKKINEIKINEDLAWREKILKFIYFNYRRSLYFNEVYNFLERCFSFFEDNIGDYNKFLIKYLIEYLDIDTELIFDNSKYYNFEYEISNLIEDKNKKMERIIYICNLEKADTYINPIGGVNVYNKNYFKKQGIDLFFIKTHEYYYKQNSYKFFKNLSIIDVLMNCGKVETKNLIHKYDLV